MQKAYATLVRNHVISIGFALLVLCTTSGVYAESFTVTLTPTEQTGTYGTYLSAPFDFGTAFSEIQSVTLEFMLPSGYQGTAATTGNSSVFRSLKLLVYDAAIPVPDYWYNSPSSFGTSAFNVPAGAPAEFRFAYSVSFGDDDSPPDWPDFLFAGVGQVGWADIVHASHHPLGDGIPVSSSTSWLLPREVRSAQLTIVGTAIPEPPSVLLVGGGMLTAAIGRAWRRRRRFAGATSRS